MLSGYVKNLINLFSIGIIVLCPIHEQFSNTQLAGRESKILLVEFLTHQRNTEYGVCMKRIRGCANKSNSLLCPSIDHLSCRQNPVDGPLIAIDRLFSSQVLCRLAQSDNNRSIDNIWSLGDFQVEFKIHF